MNRQDLMKLKKEQFYANPEMVGDRVAKNLLDWYLIQRQTILKYQGKSAVDRFLFDKYETIFIGGSRDFWWHNADKKYISNILWFLRRLKRGITLQEQKDLLCDLYFKIPIWRQFSMRFGSLGDEIVNFLGAKQ